MKQKYLRNVGLSILFPILIIGIIMPSMFNFTSIDNVENLDDLKLEFEEKIPKLLKKYRATGVGVALISNYKINWLQSFGYSDIESEKLIDTNSTYFQLASISKTMATWAVMNLWENGSIDLDAPVNTYLTRFQLESDTYNVDLVTPRRLLSHTAGTSLHGFAGIEPDAELPSIEEVLSDIELLYEPGTAWTYSGGGFTILQLLIEEVSGIQYSDYLEQEIFQPLGLDIRANWDIDIHNNTAKSYNHFYNPQPNYVFTELAAAGHYSTIEQLAQFAMAEMKGSNGELPGRGVLEPATIELMQTVVQNVDETSEIGLGHFIQVQDNGDKYIFHSGDNRGFHAFFGILPQSGDGIVVVTNSDTGINIRKALTDSWESAYHLKAQTDAYQIILPPTIIILILVVLFLSAQIGYRLLKIKKNKLEINTNISLFRIIMIGINGIVALGISIFFFHQMDGFFTIFEYLPMPHWLWIISIIDANLILSTLSLISLKNIKKIS